MRSLYPSSEENKKIPELSGIFYLRLEKALENLLNFSGLDGLALANNLVVDNNCRQVQYAVVHDFNHVLNLSNGNIQTQILNCFLYILQLLGAGVAAGTQNFNAADALYRLATAAVFIMVMFTAAATLFLMVVMLTAAATLFLMVVMLTAAAVLFMVMVLAAAAVLIMVMVLTTAAALFYLLFFLFLEEIKQTHNKSS